MNGLKSTVVNFTKFNHGVATFTGTFNNERLYVQVSEVIKISQK